MFCNNCGTQIPDGYNFCQNCGASLNTDANLTEEQQFLDDTHRFLRYERIPWKIQGIVLIICGAVIALCGLLAGICLGVASETAALGGFFTGTYFSMGAMFVGIGIVNIKMIAKVDFYLDRVYSDPKTVFARTESIGMIVFCAFFNEIALAFYIVNFVRMKCNKNVVERIKSRF